MHSDRIITLLGLNIMSEVVVENPWETYEGGQARVDSLGIVLDDLMIKSWNIGDVICTFHCDNNLICSHLPRH